MDELGEALTAAQQQVEARFNAWTDDLERAQHAVVDQLAQLAQRQKQLISEAEARIAADAERLEAESEQQRAGLVRLRDDLARATQEAVTAGTSELDSFAAERRRALHELNERMRRRERQMSELIEREETDAMRRIQAGFAEVERKQIEQLDRILQARDDELLRRGRATVRRHRARHARGCRDAAVARARPLGPGIRARSADRPRRAACRRSATRGAAAGAPPRPRCPTGLERQRAEAIANFEARLTQAEQELRRRLDVLAADTETERAVLEARLRELARKIDETLART